MKKSNVELISETHGTMAYPIDPRLRCFLDETDIPTAARLSNLINYFREPSLREIELDSGLTRPEVGILMFLSVRDGITAAEFCEYSGQLKGAVSRGVMLLERKGFVRRETDAADNRRHLLFITEEGRHTYARYIPVLKAREQSMLSCLTKSERRVFDAILDKLAVHVALLARSSTE